MHFVSRTLKVKLARWITVEAHRVVRRRGSQFLDNLDNGGEIISLTHQPPFTPRKIPGAHFC
jgi:hypothetical protein